MGHEHEHCHNIDHCQGHPSLSLHGFSILDKKMGGGSWNHGRAAWAGGGREIGELLYFFLVMLLSKMVMLI